jgi:hypothetical protein
VTTGDVSPSGLLGSQHKHFEREYGGFQIADGPLKAQRLVILLLALVLGALTYPVDVDASPVTVALSPA